MNNEKKIPKHVAIIPDGNRRWAKKKKLKPWDGHEQGAKNTEDIVRQAFDSGIKNLSIWGSSMNNILKRPLREKQALMDIYKRYFRKLIDSDDVHKNKAKINIIGRWEEQFPEPLKKVIRECVEKTKNYKKFTLNFFLAYNGDDEMIGAIKKIVEKVDDASQITAEMVKNNLLTKDLPPVDFMIRTGGEPHLSVGFMMWDIANVQLYFSDKFYPAFGKKEFVLAIEDYQRRGRRGGK